MAFAGAPARAFEPPPGSKNFTPPGSVPNYFSNEAAPFGRASQTAQPAADRFNTAPMTASGGYAVQPEPSRNTAASAVPVERRGTAARGGSGRFKSASSRASRAHVGKARGRPAHAHRSTKEASRRSAVTRRATVASRSRHAAHSAKGVRQAAR